MKPIHCSESLPASLISNPSQDCAALHGPNWQHYKARRTAGRGGGAHHVGEHGQHHVPPLRRARAPSPLHPHHSDYRLGLQTRITDSDDRLRNRFTGKQTPSPLHAHAHAAVSGFRRGRIGLAVRERERERKREREREREREEKERERDRQTDRVSRALSLSLAGDGRALSALGCAAFDQLLTRLTSFRPS